MDDNFLNLQNFCDNLASSLTTNNQTKPTNKKTKICKQNECKSFINKYKNFSQHDDASFNCGSCPYGKCFFCKYWSTVLTGGVYFFCKLSNYTRNILYAIAVAVVISKTGYGKIGPFGEKIKELFGVSPTTFRRYRRKMKLILQARETAKDKTSIANLVLYAAQFHLKYWEVVVPPVKAEYATPAKIFFVCLTKGTLTARFHFFFNDLPEWKRQIANNAVKRKSREVLTLEEGEEKKEEKEGEKPNQNKRNDNLKNNIDENHPKQKKLTKNKYGCH